MKISSPTILVDHEVKFSALAGLNVFVLRWTRPRLQNSNFVVHIPSRARIG